MKNLFAVLMLSCSLLAGSALACSLATPAHAAEQAPYKLVTAEELKDMMAKDTSLVVVDSRGGKYFDGEMIKGAVNLGADDTNAETLAKIIPTKETPVAFYCSDVNCPASEAAAHKASELGYKTIYKYKGGIADWKEKKLPTSKS